MFITAFTALAFGFTTTRASRENLRATQIMLERMEGIRVFTWEQLTNTTLNPVSFTSYYYPPGMGSGSQGITYTGAVTVANGSMSPPANYADTQMKTVTVTVSWSSGGVTRTRQMSTYIAKWGVQNYIWIN